MDGKLLHKGDSQIPFIVPVGTNALEFYLSNPKDYIDDITVWFVPDNIWQYWKQTLTDNYMWIRKRLFLFYD